MHLNVQSQSRRAGPVDGTESMVPTRSTKGTSPIVQPEARDPSNNAPTQEETLTRDETSEPLRAAELTLARRTYDLSYTSI